MRTLGTAALVLALCAGTVRADGIVVPARAVIAPVTTPGQRALIAFDGREQTLVIETRFEGEGTDFAWIVPLPSAPVVEESTRGLFPTLHALTAGAVEDEVDLTFLPVVILAAGIALAAHRRKYAGRAVVAALAVSGFLLAGIVTPSMQMSGETHKSATPGVQVLSRTTTERFETATLTTTNAGDLVAWLDANGFRAPDGIAAVAADYAAKGHVFVASRIRADVAAAGRGTVHPLSFRFPVREAVYPMRLTGVTSPSCALELFVFGDGRASAPGLDVECCMDVELLLGELGYECPDEVLRRARGAKHLTKLAGTITGAGMHEDMTLSWGEFEHFRRRYVGRERATVLALCAGAIAACVALTVAGLAKRRWFLACASVGLLTGAATFLAQPPLPAGGSALSRDEEKRAREWQKTQRPAFADLAAARAWAASASAGVVNPYTGTPVREEDSPGNYVVRDVHGKLELVLYECEPAWGSARQRSVNITAPGLTGELRSTRTFTVRGVIRDADGVPVTGADVFLVRAEPRRTLRVRDFLSGGERTTTSASGRFEFAHVTDELFDLGVHKDLHAMRLVEDFDPRTGGDTVVTLPRGATLAGKVLRPDGTPIAGADVLTQPTNPFHAPRGTWVSTGAQGEFRIPGLPENGEPFEVWVRVTLDRRDDFAETFVVTAPGPVDLRVDPGDGAPADADEAHGFVIRRLGAAPPADEDALTNPLSRVTACPVFRPRRDEFACADGEGAIQLVEARTGRVLRTIDGPGAAPWSIAFDRLGARVIVNRSGESVVVASVIGDAGATRYERHGCFVAFARGRAVAITGGHDGPWRIIDVETGAETTLPEAAQDLMAYDMGLSTDGTRLFGFTGSRDLVAWDTWTGEISLRARRRGDRGPVRASDTGRRAVIVGRTMRCIDTDDPAAAALGLGPLPDDARSNPDAAVSPDRRWFALRVGGRVILRSLDDGRVRATLEGFTPSYRNDLAFSDDGRLLVAGTHTAGVACVWDVEAATR